MEDKKIRVGITQGDANGVGLELILKTFAAPEILDLCTPIIYGSPKVAVYHRNALKIDANFSIIHHAKDAREMRVNMLTVADHEVKIDLGIPSPEAGQIARLSFDKALEDYQAGLIDVLVPAPVHETTFYTSDESYPNLSSYILKQLGIDAEPLCITVDNALRVTTVVGGTPIKDVVGEVKKENVIKKTKQLLLSLKRDFRVENPRVAVLALNPHSTDEQPGKEEQEAIIPAIKQMVGEGINVFGPYQAESFFGEAEYDSFDGILAMYYDQGILPLKALSVDGTLKLITGLPLVCVTSDDDVSYDKAGKNLMDEMAFRHAIFLAMDVYRNRINYDRPFANPLKKLYHDKREEGDRGKSQSASKKQADEKKQEGEIQDKQSE